MSPSRRSPCLLVAASWILATTGCQSLMLGNPSDDAPSHDAALAAASEPEKFSIEFYPVSDKPERLEMPLQSPLFVQEALEKSEALKRFRREKIQLYRKTQGSTPYSRLEVTYDHGKRRVPPESDYAIHPGDRLIIAEDTSTFFDDAVSAMRTPWGGILGTR
jgi:hypothetical protein